MENITENNKLIAEFLELEYKILPVYLNDKFLGRKNIYYAPFKRDIKNKVFTPTFPENNLKFHSDWNWLKLVLEKISYLNKDNFSDETKQALEDLLSLSLFSAKENVYKSIINFIKTIK